MATNKIRNKKNLIFLRSHTWAMGLLATAYQLCIPPGLQMSSSSKLSFLYVASVDAVYLKHFFCEICEISIDPLQFRGSQCVDCSD